MNFFKINNWILDISDIGEINYLNQNSVFNNKVILVNDEDEIVYFDLGLKKVLGIYPFPIDDIFKINNIHIYMTFFAKLINKS